MAEILEDIIFGVNAGKMEAIMGPSGSGKSPLLYQVSGMDRADSSEVWIDGTEFCALSKDDRAKRRLSQMGFVFQKMNMLKNLNLLDNILLPSSCSTAFPIYAFRPQKVVAAQRLLPSIWGGVV